MRGTWLKRTHPEIGELPELDESSVFYTCVFILAGFSIFFFGIYIYAFLNSERNEVVKIVSLRSIDDTYLVYTDKGEYICEDSAFFGDKNRYKIFSSLKQGKKYNVRVVGMGRKNIIQASLHEENNNVRN